MMSGLLLGIVLSVRTCWFHKALTLPSWLVSSNFGTCCSVGCRIIIIIIIIIILLLKVKFTLEQAAKTQRGSRCIALLFP
jgi:hypothetical protein